MTVEIKTEDYRVYVDESTETIVCDGSLRLNGVDEYAPIIKILNDVAGREPGTITLDLRGLNFLNSSGINVFSKFVIAIRQKGATDLIVRGSTSVPWQSKSLLNLQRLMPKLQLVID